MRQRFAIMLALVCVILPQHAVDAIAANPACAQSFQMRRAADDIATQVAAMAPEVQDRLLKSLDCKLEDYGSVDEAIDACSCRHFSFMCNLAAELLDARKLDPFGRAALTCHLG